MKSYCEEARNADSLSARVYRHLEAALREGSVRPGIWLDQDALCAELGVSRTPLRDALIRLEAEGLVVIRPRKGVYVPPVSDAYVKSACALAGSLESGCLDTVFERIHAPAFTAHGGRLAPPVLFSRKTAAGRLRRRGRPFP